jgi:signal transduction histidine kinase
VPDGYKSARAWPLRGLDRLPIRWRLAVVSATLTGVILLLFAVAVGSVTTQRIEGDFTTQTAARFGTLRDELDIRLDERTGQPVLRTSLRSLASERGTVVTVWARNGDGYTQLGSSNSRVDIGRPTSSRTRFGDIRVAMQEFDVALRNIENGKTVTELGVPIPSTNGDPFGTAVFRAEDPNFRYTVPVAVRIGRSFDAVERTTRRVWIALALGVFGGTWLALVAGLALATRAMRPVRRMTSTARQIARTRNLDAKMPTSPVNDEIAELAGTLQDMLDELAAAQATVDGTLQRQREFIADASHELRTPLTAVQANLELLALSTEGDDREAAESALRSSRRMRRLVADLLLLARMDASREGAREPVDLDRAILEAVDELEPQLGGHEIDLDLEPVTLDGIRDELVRMVANLVGNALRHTPEGTEIRVVLRRHGATAELVVEDDGPGVPTDLRPRIFDRFVRRGGESAGSTGIGLAIVRAAAQRHGGDVRVEATHPESYTGARFVVRVDAHVPTSAAEGDDPEGRDGDGAAGPADPADPDGGGSDEGARAASGAARRSPLGIRRRLRGTGRGPSGGTGPAERLGGAGPSDD